MSWRHRRQVDAETRILAELGATPDAWRYGLDLMRLTKMRGGRFYPTLDRLESAELIEAQWDDSEPEREYRRRMYRLVTRSEQ